MNDKKEQEFYNSKDGKLYYLEVDFKCWCHSKGKFNNLTEEDFKAYKKEFDNCTDDRRNELESQIKTIESILEAEDFAAAYIKHRNKQFIIDAVTNVDLEILKAFNLGYRNYTQVIKPLRVCLFKKLSELNALLEKQ